MVGVLTGFRGPVDTTAIITKAINLRGVYVGSVANLQSAMGSDVRPIIDEVFALEQADAAFARMRSGLHFGKIVVEIAAQTR